MILSFEQCNSIIDNHLRSLSTANRNPLGLYEPIDYVMSCGGKRIRPILTLMACNIFSDNFENALAPAAAFEIFHNFTLMHDDLMDNADVRRNRPTVHKRWNANTAVLSGDAMQILAFQQMCDAKPDVLPALLDTFTQTALEVCEGQQYDMEFEQRDDVSIEEYITMIRLKTAMLLAACIKAGAICGGASEEYVKLLHRFGIYIGISFQIQDDWLDLYGDPDVFGKAIGGDILSGKKTFLLLTALKEADEKTAKELMTLLKDKKIANDKKIENVRAIYDYLDVSNIAQEAVIEYYHKSTYHISDVLISDPSRKKPLEMLAKKLTSRTK